MTDRSLGRIRGIVGRAWIVVSACLAAAPASWAESIAVEPDGFYEVTYQVTERESRTVKSVKVPEIVLLGTKEFLVIEPTTSPQPTRGYVALERVSAILPVRLGGAPIVRSDTSSTRVVSSSSP